MKAVGIIAEYNPLHNGHIYNMEEARRLAGSDAVVVAMSGNYVQRGEPAILDKWTRSRHAIVNGADLVVEIPALFSLGNAGQYAKAGVALLEGLGCVEHIAFGSESGNIDDLRRVADNLDKYKSEIEEKLAKHAGRGLSYPAAREAAYKDILGGSEFLGEDIKLLNNSNDILAVEYIRACHSAEPIAVRRLGAGYNDGISENAKFQSASAIRRLADEGADISKYVPKDVMQDIADRCKLIKSSWYELIRYAAVATDPSVIDNCPSGGEGLGNRLKRCVYAAENLEELILLVKTKKYTYGRISRLCAQLVLRIFNEDYKDCEVQYIRVLAFSDRGRELLAEIKSEELNTLPIITNIARESGKLDEKAKALVELEARASDIYNSVSGYRMDLFSDYRQNPMTRIKYPENVRINN